MISDLADSAISGRYKYQFYLFVFVDTRFYSCNSSILLLILSLTFMFEIIPKNIIYISVRSDRSKNSSFSVGLISNSIIDFYKCCETCTFKIKYDSNIFTKCKKSIPV